MTLADSDQLYKVKFLNACFCSLCFEALSDGCTVAVRTIRGFGAVTIDNLRKNYFTKNNTIHEQILR